MNMSQLLRQAITIPAIQREFTMGRSDRKTTEIRRNFTAELLKSVFTDQHLNLDFVYGLQDGDALLPLDGQQRLTMLFLLAWFCKADFSAWNFEYESRRSAEFFMDGLKKHPRSSDNMQPSAEIVQSLWFFPAWKTDPSVDGMLTVLDTMYKEFNKQKYDTLAKFENIQFEYLPIPCSNSAGDEYGEIFLKMNARGLPLTSWENCKAILDQYADADWKEHISEWQEKIWEFTRGTLEQGIERTDTAMEKIIRIFISSFCYTEETKESQYDLTLTEIGEIAVQHKGSFFKLCSSCFERIDQIGKCWSKDRRKTGEDSCPEFAKWLYKESTPSYADQLRLIYLADDCCIPRRIRVLMNLLDNTDVSPEKFAVLMDEGLIFLHEGKLPAHFDEHQLKDEKYKASLPENEIRMLEADPLVWQGSLSFLHPDDCISNLSILKERLDFLRKRIHDENWKELFFTLLQFMEYRKDDEAHNIIPETVFIPPYYYDSWNSNIFSNGKSRLRSALQKIYEGAWWDYASAPIWLQFLWDNWEICNLPAIGHKREWNFCFTGSSLSGRAIRLPWSREEWENLNKFNAGKPLYWGDIPYIGYWSADGTTFYQVADKGDSSWYDSECPQQFRREQLENGDVQFVKA